MEPKSDEFLPERFLQENRDSIIDGVKGFVLLPYLKVLDREVRQE